MSALTADQQKKFSRCFPRLLHFVLSEVEQLGLDHIISWQPNGQDFRIHDQKLFLSEIVPQFFAKQTKLRSFYRQLNLWGYQRIGKNVDNVWGHEFFVRGDPEGVKLIKRCERASSRDSNGNDKSSIGGKGKHSSVKGAGGPTATISVDEVVSNIGHCVTSRIGIERRHGNIVRVSPDKPMSSSSFPSSSTSSSNNTNNNGGDDDNALFSMLKNDFDRPVNDNFSILFQNNQHHASPTPDAAMSYSNNVFTNVSDDEQEEDGEGIGHADYFMMNVENTTTSSTSTSSSHDENNKTLDLDVDGGLSFLEGVTDINEFMEQPTLIMDDDVTLDDDIDYENIFEVGVQV